MPPAPNRPASVHHGADSASRAEHRRRQLEAAADNATLALFVLDERRHCTYMNPAAERLTGYTLAEVEGKTLHEVVHHTRPDGTPYPPEECPIERAFLSEVREGGAEVFVRPDGSFYPVAFTASPIRDGGRTVGALVEVREIPEEDAAVAGRERLLRERERLLGELETERARLQQIFLHAPALISVTRGPDHVFELVNPFYQRMMGGRELLGRPLREALPELRGQGYFEMRDALYAAGGTHVQSEARILADLDGDGEPEEHVLNFVTQALRDPSGEVDGILTFAVDVTEQVHARGVVEAQAAELEAQTEELHRHALRVEVLAEAGAVLGSAMELGATLAGLARVLVPRLADWYFVEMPAEDGRIELAAVHHSDPARVALAHETLRRFPVDPAAPYGTAKVLRTGEPELVGEVPAELLEAVARDAEHLEVLRSVGFRSHVSVPLSVRGRTVGVLSLVMAESGRCFTAGDLPLVEELGRRAALAVDNARLYAAEQAARRVAERAADRSHRLQAVAAALNQAATRAEVAEVCIRHGRDALGADAGSLALLVEDGSVFEVVHTEGFDSALAARWRRFPVTPGGPLSDAVLGGAPVLLGLGGDWSGPYRAALGELEARGTVAFAAAPLVVAGRALGGLSFSFCTERGFDDADRVFVSTLSEQAAQALERARLLDAERAAREEAEAANRAKTDFLSAMSHELRTPLNAIAGYTDLLDLEVHGPVTDAQRADLARIRHAQGVLLGLISDILNFARIEAGRIEIARDPVPVAGLLEELEGIVRPQVRARGLSYEQEPAPDGLALLGDPDRVRQVLMNLLSNAVKFTPPGGWIRVGAEADGDRVRIRVSDSGRGIPPEKLRTVFEPFVQVDRQGSAESQQGVGLGLAISRELAHGMGGELRVESTVGAGSTFTLVLPAAEPDYGGPTA